VIVELAQDFHDAVEAMPTEHPKHRMLELLERAIQGGIDFITRHPTTLFQCMWNTCWWYDCPEAADYDYVTSSLPESPYFEEARRVKETLEFLTPMGYLLHTEPPWRELGPNIFEMLKAWRLAKECVTPMFCWIRSLKPPHMNVAQTLCRKDYHRKEVNCIVVSPDGRYVGSGSSDGTICVWNVKNGKLILQFHDKTWVRAVAFSSDNRHIASAGGEFDQGTIRIWNIETGTQVRCINGVVPFCVSFAPDGTQIAGGDIDGNVHFWKTNTGSHVGYFSGSLAVVRSIAFSPDSSRIVGADWHGTICMWDINTGAKLWCKAKHTAAVLKLSFDPDGIRLVSGGVDLICVWNANTGDCLEVIKAYDGDVMTIAEHGQWRALFYGKYETVIEDARTGHAISWYPSQLARICGVYSSRTWAGSDYSFVDIIRFEGGEAS